MTSTLEAMAHKVVDAVGERMYEFHGSYEIDRESARAAVLLLLSRVRNEALTECWEIAVAIDSRRGNEAEIAKAISALKQPKDA